MIKNLWTKFLDTAAPMKQPEISTLDVADGIAIVIPCPPEHGKHCTCTWY